MQLLVQPDNSDTRVFWLHITSAPEVPNITTSPEPASLPLSYTGTELTFSVCRSGVDFKKPHQEMSLGGDQFVHCVRLCRLRRRRHVVSKGEHRWGCMVL